MRFRPEFEPPWIGRPYATPLTSARYWAARSCRLAGTATVRSVAPSFSASSTAFVISSTNSGTPSVRSMMSCLTLSESRLLPVTPSIIAAISRSPSRLRVSTVTLGRPVHGGSNSGRYVTISAGGGGKGFLYINGLYATIDYPSARQTNALGINDGGQIVGTSIPDRSTRGRPDDVARSVGAKCEGGGGGQAMGDAIEQTWLSLLLLSLVWSLVGLEEFMLRMDKISQPQNQ
jgi:hypothetical protein